MRKLLLLLPAILLLAACNISSLPGTTSTGKNIHWKRTEAVATIYVQVDSTAEVLRPLLVKSASDWSKAKYVDLVVLGVGVTATPGSSFVAVRGEIRNGSLSNKSWGSDGHILWAWSVIDNNVPIDWQRQNAVCHEYGHWLGLKHGTSPGPCQGGVPTAWDIAMIDSIYEHRHVT